MPRGENNKLSKEQWEEIKVLYMIGDESIRAIARDFGLTDGAIRRRAKRYGWQRSAEMCAHIEERAHLEHKLEEIKAKEAVFPEIVKNEIDMKVLNRKDALAKFSHIQGMLFEDVWEMWRHDNKVKPVVGEEHESSRYGKAKVVQDVMTQAKKNMIGDAPILPDEKEGQGDEVLVIPVPQAEAERVKRIEDSENEGEK